MSSGTNWLIGLYLNLNHVTNEVSLIFAIDLHHLSISLSFRDKNFTGLFLMAKLQSPNYRPYSSSTLIICSLLG